jgi:hypothetical protein
MISEEVFTYEKRQVRSPTLEDREVTSFILEVSGEAHI